MCISPYRPNDFRTEVPQSAQQPREVFTEEGESGRGDLILELVKKEPTGGYQSPRTSR